MIALQKLQISYPISVYLLWRGVILLYQIFIQPLYFLTPSSIDPYQRLFISWVTGWDAGHYTGIAQAGYIYPQQAFFPLLPLLSRILALGTAPSFELIYLLDFVISMAGFCMFYIVAKKMVGQYTAKLALILFASFPTTLFLHANYSEGLFLILTLLVFFFEDSKHYLIAATCCLFSSMSRLVGSANALTFLFLNQKSQSLFKRIAFFTIGLGGLFLFMIFLWINYSNPLLFLNAQKEWCLSGGRCGLVIPVVPLINFGILLFNQPSLIQDLSPIFADWFLTIIFILMLPLVFFKLGIRPFVYSLTCIILPLASGSIVAMSRYLLVVFPVFFIFPTIIKSRILFLLICLLFLLWQLKFVAFFTGGVWVA